MDDAVAAYLEAIPAEHRPLFDRVERLLQDEFPDAAVRISYGIPTYERGSRRLYVGTWQHGVSLYGWSAGEDGGFAEKHPKLLSGKGTIKLTTAAAADVDDDDLLALVRATLGDR